MGVQLGGTFRAICEDYGEALRALDYWQTTASSSQKVEEYRQIGKELEVEALAIREACKTSWAPARGDGAK